MQTAYDWVTVALFAALIVLFLQRSAAPGPPKDHILHYLPPAIGCAVANYLGNEGHDLFAIAAIGAVIAYVALVLRPFDLRL